MQVETKYPLFPNDQTRLATPPGGQGQNQEKTNNEPFGTSSVISASGNNLGQRGWM